MSFSECNVALKVQPALPYKVWLYHTHEPFPGAKREPVSSCPWRDTPAWAWKEALPGFPLPSLASGQGETLQQSEECDGHSQVLARWERVVITGSYLLLLRQDFGQSHSVFFLFPPRLVPALFIKDHTTSELLTFDCAVRPTNYCQG